MRTEAIRYLNAAGFDFKSAESPDLWTHLESHFYGKQPVGAKFNPLPADAITDMIFKGEEALLDALMLQHQTTGHLTPVTRIMDMPFDIGIDSAMPMASGKMLDLIDQPGTAAERVIHVMPTPVELFSPTRQATIKGGVYANGHTVGFFDLIPGNHVNASMVHATPTEILTLAHDMEMNVEDIALVTRQECDAMIARARKALKA